ncbi:MAG: hypothetical protein WKG07_35900 [Hymenobacter sp.]
MLFPTLTFAVFFALVCPVCWLLRWRDGAWKVFVLGASYYFYASWNWRFVLLIFASSSRQHPLGATTGPETHRAVTPRAETPADAVPDGEGIESRTRSGHRPQPHRPRRLQVLRLLCRVAQRRAARHWSAGASALRRGDRPRRHFFFTFQAISYVVDVYHRRIPPAPWLDVAVYLTFFPHPVAGPIVRAAEFLALSSANRAHAPRPGVRPTASGPAHLRAGLVEEGLVIARLRLALTVADLGLRASRRTNSRPRPIVRRRGHGYAASRSTPTSAGYTDMAIGLAIAARYRPSPQNFRYGRTAAASRCTDFWRRWHGSPLPLAAGLSPSPSAGAVGGNSRPAGISS